MNNLVYVVTGGNRGIGCEICKQLAELKKDATIILAARDLSKASEVVSKLGYKNIKACQLDVTSTDSINAFAQTLTKEFGGVDVLINNAGYAIRGSDLNEKIAADTIGTNYFGLLKVSEALLPLLKTRPDGRIVNVSSTMGEFATRYSAELKQKLLSPTLTKIELGQLLQQFISDVKNGVFQQNGWPSNSYAVSKVGVNMLTRIMARDEKNVTINSVCPGWVKTDMGGPNAPGEVDQGAKTPVWLATAPLTEIKLNGTFF